MFHTDANPTQELLCLVPQLGCGVKSVLIGFEFTFMPLFIMFLLVFMIVVLLPVVVFVIFLGAATTFSPAPRVKPSQTQAGVHSRQSDQRSGGPQGTDLA